jgi:hypothetical protein
LGVAHHKFVHIGQTVNFAFDISVLKHLMILFGGKGQKNKTIGFYTMTVCLVTLALQCSSFW